MVGTFTLLSVVFLAGAVSMVGFLLLTVPIDTDDDIDRGARRDE